jgi:putative membrane protein
VTSPPPTASLPHDAAWHRLHPLSPLVRAGRQMVTIVIAVLLLFFFNQHQGNELVVDAILVVLALVGGVISWLVTRWQLTDGVLRIETGLIRRQSRRFPLSQVQAIDVVQTGLARVLGLAEIQLRMAGGGSSGGRLACLRLDDAEQLRQRLLAMTQASAARPAAAPAAPAAPGVAGVAGVAGVVGAPSGAARITGGPAPAPAAPAAPGADLPAAGAGAAERPLFRVEPVRLAGAIVLSRAGAIAAVVIAGMACVAAFSGQPGTVASFLPIAVGVVVAVWRQFNGEFGTTVAAAPDGLRLRSGLVQTTAETIRPGRVQAVRLVEPMLWRLFGWCRLEVDVAGSHQREENRSEAQRLRALIPVGSRAQAQQMLGELLTTPPAATRRAPSGARWKAPLTYHFLAWGGDQRYVVAARGRIRRETTWVPLEKVQSVRWMQGPAQRRLGLASVKLDVAGKRVTASIQDRATAEAEEMLRRLPALARAARSQPRPARQGGQPGR